MEDLSPGNTGPPGRGPNDPIIHVKTDDEKKKEKTQDYQREWRSKNRERIRATNKLWRIKNKDRIKEHDLDRKAQQREMDNNQKNLTFELDISTLYY